MITGLDHMVLTVQDIERTCAFYREVLGLPETEFAPGRWGIPVGRQRLNLHQRGREFTPRAKEPTAGSADLCLVVTRAPDELMAHLAAHQVPIEHGPVPKTGALGSMTSIYVRDPDGNLVELARYDP